MSKDNKFWGNANKFSIIISILSIPTVVPLYITFFNKPFVNMWQFFLQNALLFTVTILIMAYFTLWLSFNSYTRLQAKAQAEREAKEAKYREDAAKAQAKREAKEAKYREDTENYLYYLACAVKAHTIMIGNYKQIHPLVGDLREGGMSKDEYHTYMNGKAPYPPFPAWEENID